MASKSGVAALLASSAIIQVVGLFITIGLGVIFARVLGPANYGRYGLTMAVVSIAIIPAQFGLPLLATREAATLQASSAGRRQLSVWFMRRSLGASFLVATVLFIGLSIYRPSWAAGDTTLIWICAALVGGTAFLTLLLALLRGFGANLTGQAIDLIVKPTLMVGWGFVLAFTGELGVQTALLGQAAAMAICIGVAGVVLVRSTHGDRGSVDLYRPSEWRKAGAAIMANSLLIALNGNYPLLVAGLYVAGDPIGIFRVALSAVALLSLPSTIANVAAGPRVAGEHARGDTHAITRTLSYVTIGCFGATLAIYSFMILFGKGLFLIVFGHRFVGAYVPFLVLGAAPVIISAFGIAGTYLNLTGHHSVVLRASMIAVPLGLVCTLFLTPVLGINGTAAGTVIMAAAWNAYVVIYKSKLVDAPLSLIAAIKALTGRSAETRSC